MSAEGTTAAARRQTGSARRCAPKAWRPPQGRRLPAGTGRGRGRGRGRGPPSHEVEVGEGEGQGLSRWAQPRPTLLRPERGSAQSPASAAPACHPPPDQPPVPGATASWRARAPRTAALSSKLTAFLSHPRAQTIGAHRSHRRRPPRRGGPGGGPGARAGSCAGGRGARGAPSLFGAVRSRQGPRRRTPQREARPSPGAPAGVMPAGPRRPPIAPPTRAASSSRERQNKKEEKMWGFFPFRPEKANF